MHATDERILVRTPAPIAQAWLRMLQEREREPRVRRLVEVVLVLYDLLARLAIADIGLRWTGGDRPAALAQLARSRLVRPQLGHQHELVRAWLKACDAAGRPTPLGSAHDLARNVFTERRFGELVNLRNFVTKRTAEWKERMRAYPEAARGYEDAVRDAILSLQALETGALVLVGEPVENGLLCRVDGQLRGAFPLPLPLNEAVDIDASVAWRDAGGELWPLSPLYAWEPCACAACGGARVAARVEWPSGGDAQPPFTALADGHTVVSARLGERFSELKASLSADWRWQQDPYLAGHLYRATEYSVHLSVENLHGDTRNRHRIQVERILAEAPDTATFKVDYHDQVPPVPDRVFGLRVHDVSRDEPFVIDTEEQYVWSDGFRSFEVGFTTPLALGEERLLALDMMEPGLFTNVGAASRARGRARDYYELSIHVPAERVALRISFPEGAAPDLATVRVAYLERRSQTPRVVAPPALETREDGGVDLTFAVARPRVDHNLFVTFAYARTATLDAKAPVPWYWAAHRVYEQLGAQPDQLWTDEDVARLLGGAGARRRRSP